MNNFLSLIIFLISLKLNIILCESCSETKNFIEIKINSPLEIKIKPKEEYCYKYNIANKNSIIGLSFINGISYTSKVYIYDSIDAIKKGDNDGYTNYKEEYAIGKDPFKEINANNYRDFIYIIVIEKYFYFSYYILLYDSGVAFPLEPGEPLTVKQFMSNGKYIATFSSSKTVTIVYTSKIKGKKLITILEDNSVVMPKKKDENDIIEKYNNSLKETKNYKIIIEKESKNEINNEEQEFNLIFYEDLNEFRELGLNKNYKINYLNLNDDSHTQKFKFYVDVSSFRCFSSINFKLDYKAKKHKYINITTNIKKLGELSQDSINDYEFKGNELYYEYDFNSDEYLRYYFNVDNYNETKETNEMILIQVEIMKYNYTIPKNFIISIGGELNSSNINGSNNNNIFTFTNITAKDYIPTYLHINGLKEKRKYFLQIPFSDQITIFNGKIIENGKLNKNIRNETTELHEIKGLSEITIRFFGNQTDFVITIQYLKKPPNETLLIPRNLLKNEEFKYEISETECRYKTIYFILKYDIYTDGYNEIEKYWTKGDKANFSIYYDNNTNNEENEEKEETKNLFPFKTNTYKREEKMTITSTNTYDVLAINCTKPGTFYYKPRKKVFQEITHELSECSSIYKFTTKKKKEVIQLRSENSPSLKTIYITILSLNKTDIKLTPDKLGPFDKNEINNEKTFYSFKIDAVNYNMDEMAVFLSANINTNIEVTETTDHDLHLYQKISIDKKKNNYTIFANNFVIFLNDDIKDLIIKFDDEVKNYSYYYGIVKLPLKNERYIPLADNFEETINDNANNDIYIDNENITNIKTDNYKKYKAFILSMESYERIKSFNIEIECTFISNLTSIGNIILIISLIIALIVPILVYIKNRVKNKRDTIAILEDFDLNVDDDDD